MTIIPYNFPEPVFLQRGIRAPIAPPITIDPIIIFITKKSSCGDGEGSVPTQSQRAKRKPSIENVIIESQRIPSSNSS